MVSIANLKRSQKKCKREKGVCWHQNAIYASETATCQLTHLKVRVYLRNMQNREFGKTGG